jgi:hypothetical protein
VSGSSGDELTDAQAEALAKAVEAGEDSVVVPIEYITDGGGPADAAKAQSLHMQILGMTMGERIKLALRGNKDARTILLRDTNKLVRRFVLQNARISDGEVLAVARNRNADDELIRTICESREWMRNYQVRLAVATNPKTPLPIAIRQVQTLLERDLRVLGKSKNVPEAVAAQARRLLFARREGGGAKA